MEKLRMSFQQLHDVEILTREQLKKVLGGKTTPYPHPCVTPFGCSWGSTSNNLYDGYPCCDENSNLTGQTCKQNPGSSGSSCQ